VPEIPDEIFNQDKHDEAILTSLLLSDQYNEIYDCDFSLYNRIISFSQHAKTLDELIYKCTTSAYTSSKVRRAIFSILFNTKREHVKTMPLFTVLLGASQKGLEYISQNKKKFDIPILTRATDEKKYSISTEKNFKCDKLYALLNRKNYTPYGKPYIHN
jgi:predicted nucleotidyltransferase